MRRTPTRRQLLTGALATTAGAVALGTSGSAAAAAEGDAPALERTLRIEELVAIAYESVLATDVLRPGVRRQLVAMLAQERRHVAALGHALNALGSPLPTVTRATAAQMLTKHQIHVTLTHLPTEHVALRLLIDVESLAEGAYFSAIGELSDPGLVRTCAEAMGCEAQHWTLLSGLQHHGDPTRSVPYPFVQGSP